MKVTVNTYLNSEKKKDKYAVYFFEMLYRTLIPIFSLIIMKVYYNILSLKLIFLSIALFFIFAQIKVKTK